MKHDAWVHAPPPEPSIFRSIERFVVKGAAPDIPSDAQPEVPDSEDAILLPPPPDRHPTPCGGYMPEGHTQQSLILNWPFFLDAQDLAQGTIHSWNWMEGLAGFRSCHCTGWSYDGHSCAGCASLKHLPALSQRLRIAMAPEPRTKYKYRGTLALHARLHEYRAMEQKAFFDVGTMQRSFQPLRSQMSYHQRLVEAIQTNNVPRVATVLNAAKKRGYGLKRLVGLVEDAATANRTRYSADEKDLCVLLYRAGGPSVCHALSQAHLFPSVSHCRGLAKKDAIPLPSEFSFDSCFQAWAGKPAIGLTEHHDDLFLIPRLSLGKRDMIEGLCGCAPPKRFEALADLQEVMQKLQSGEWQLAKYACVVALSRHSETGYECIPVSCQASCNRFKAVAEQQSVETLLESWEPHAAQYGPILCHASDADSRRRAALREMCLPPTAFDGQPLHQKIVTRDGATVSRDMRHVLKRTTRRFLNKGITIDDVHLTPYVLVGLGKTMKLGYVDALSAALQRPFDPALYYDWQLELCGVFDEVEMFQRGFPGEPFFICHRGNDRLEGTFSVCKMGSGAGGCLDIVQLRYRLAIVVQMSAIDAKHPEWKVIRKRAATGDNITPATAGSCTDVIDCAAVWNAGLDMASAELKKDLRAMAVAGVGIFSPFGVSMEIGTVDDAEEVLDDPDDLLECDEEDQLEQTFTNDSMIFFEGKLTSKQHVLNELRRGTVSCVL